MRYPTMKAAAALAAGLLMLAACSRSGPEQAPEAENMAEATPVEDVTPVAPPSDEPAPVETNAIDANAVAIAPPPEAPTAPDAQMLEDADATGMTARVSRDEAPAGNDQADQ
ncbi:hypothetical protein LPN01_13175 [Sphingomonas sp. A2-49]|uniref:hypothetical protein n=1 Tax=Sphingomonas sp. A2-49 TaxID=1391375 RepID=UPI0021D2EA2B|nr:hypothetical protein [Sphingomonas sp. A2-49]MCU6455032.1 hypothetical protein [Sphingomonas sp. A2-49]